MYLQKLVKKGSTDQSVIIRIIDSSDGSPETAVEHNTSGIDMWYRRDGGAVVSITEAALASADAAHADGGIEHLGNGYYRLDLPDAAVDTGANGVMIGGTVTGMVVIGTYLQLVDFDPQNAVRLGLTALPNAAADAAGGLPISDAGGLDLDALRTDVAAILVDTAEIGAAGAGLTAVPWNASWDAQVESEVTDALNAYDPPTNAEFEARTIASADYATATNLATVAGYLDTEIASILEDTGTTIPGLLSTIEGKVDTVDTNVDSILDDTGTAGVVVSSIAANAITASALNADAATEIATAVLAATADTGVSVAKALEMLAALCAGKVSASSNGTVTTLTYKKRDGTTTSFTVAVTEADKTRATTGALS